MKTKIVLLMLLLTSSIMATNISDVKSFYFYGVDYSHCIVNGASESQADFIDAFCRINELFYSEKDKYSLKRFNREVIDINIGETNERNMQANNFIKYSNKVNRLNEDTITSIIKNIKIENNEGFGMIMLCECLDKSEGFGYYSIVFFDNNNREIIHTIHVMGRSGGFGLRNYWANTIHEILKKRYKF